MVLLENCWPLVSLVSRRHVLSARTCPPRTHTDHETAPLALLVHSPARRRVFPLPLPDSTRLRSEGRSHTELSSPFHSPHSPCSPHTLSRVLLTRTQARPFFESFAPFWHAASSLRQSGQRHASFPRHRDRWVFTPGEIAAVCFSCCR